MRRILFALCGALAAVTLASCNEHAVDECLPLCAASPRNEALFADCVAFGNDDCRAGNRRCCALDVGCVGDLADQRVVGPADCRQLTAPSCLPECEDEDEDYFEACLADGSSFCPSGDEACCAMDTGCLGTLGGVSVMVEGGLACCEEDSDCLRDELCDPSMGACVSAACGETGLCPAGNQCVDGECICRDEGARCPSGEYCVDGRCAEDPCGGCPAETFCDPFSGVCEACAIDDATCDGIDDDCDGDLDEDFGESVVCGIGLCQNTGFSVCIDGVVIEDCTPNPPPFPVDECFGGPVDDDCDGVVDEDCNQCDNGVAGSFEECDTDDLRGESCASLGFDDGTLTCAPFECVLDVSGCTCVADRDGDGDCDSTDCAPGDANRGRFNFEDCDLVDNDCDGFTDEEPAASESCDDFLYCNGVEACDVEGCVSGPPPCDDGNDCTDDPCDEATASCGSPTPSPVDTVCTDSMGRLGFCDGAGTCIAG